ncbi:MAG: hypothetical protein HQL56_09985 [Magnetococcales bacterium]|nr:hypothetical protein [Magnetococcales bacterium]
MAQIVSGGATTRVASLPAPIGGWNAAVDLGNLPSNQALVLDNWIPRSGWVEMRRGYQEHATAHLGAVESLMAWDNGSSTKLLSASNNGKVFDITSAGVVGSPLVTGLTSARFQHVNFRGYLFAVNGQDTPGRYNGTTWTDPGFTGAGLVPANLIGVAAHKSRLFFIERDSANYWYAPVNNITGALSKVELSGLAPEGGNLMAIGTWTRDGGAGSDDLAVFLFSSGNCLVYSGTDPGSASSWSLVGLFRIGRPLGRRCLLRAGSDLIAVTEEGYLSLSKVLPMDRLHRENALSRSIEGAVLEATRTQAATFGWQGVLHPRNGVALFNVPVGSGVFHQHVLNTATGAWCRFTGQQALCWSTCGEELYFGTSAGTVFKADVGTADNNTNIQADARTGFHRFGYNGVKRFTMIRPVMASEGRLPVSIGFDTDFADHPNTFQASTISSAGSPWNTSPWNSSPWQRGVSISAEWQSVSGVGYTAAVRLRTETKYQSVRWHALEVRYEPGGGL